MIPVRGPHGLEVGVLIAGRHIDLPDRARPVLYLIAIYGVTKLCKLIQVSPRPRADLTDRERDVLAWSARGMSAGEIATILRIKKRTVDEHVQNACRRIGAQNRTHAVVLAMRNRLIYL
jgi:LuxR family transcriptional regulator, quorum-sensing system regulator BjaR1